MVNRSLISRLYGISRPTLIKWEDDGTYYGKLAGRGIAIDPSYVEDLVAKINPARFDDLTALPPRDLSEEEKQWFRICYSYPRGPIMDPRPRAGAPKGVYYDETERLWRPRPFVHLPGSS
jgi:hypothetical protein